ncbi:MAG: GntR family transcriptional regulator [Hungatella sp.]|nr:GntR family transcriptional regulator [Hungatella sp.]MCI8951369.1 GntR family transcriptional regulator [Lachnospiraceae bacterium]
MQVLERLYGEGAREYVLRVLKKNIIECALKPGEMLSENTLTEELHVSRTPVREALVELSKIDLIEVLPKKGSRVTKINYGLVEESNFARKVLERAIVEICCQLEELPDLGRLEENIRLQKKYLEMSNQSRLLELDDDFHRLLFRMAKKEHVYDYLEDIRIPFDRIRYLSLLVIVDLQTVNDHMEILNAVRAQNKEEAFAVVDKHLSRYLYDKAEIVKRYPDYII